MRLVCPNCEAKYEVPEDAIPETGRDVQCANCGHAWFQMRRGGGTAETAVPAVAPAPVAASVAAIPTGSEAAVADPAPVETPAVAEEAVPVVADDPVEPEPAETVAERVEPVAEVTPVAVTQDVAADEADAPEDDAVPPEAPAVAAGAAAYAVDDSVLAILREEAEREAKARQAEAARPLETQADLGIEQAMPVASKVPDVIAEDPALVARRARLPDVEEINSTLRPSEAAEDDMAPDMSQVAAADGRSSFRSGFLLVLTLAILGSAVYGSADALAEAVPALAEPLKGYVAFVDSLRLQLDGLMQSATVAINGT
jgi:predicted Zn finger-like uncharacterized protein